MKLHEVITQIKQQVAAANNHKQSASNALVKGDDSEYKRGGVEMANGILKLLEEVEK